ncbi:MAG: 30S ribosomal protein S16 [Armatimonadia bacterium]|nr:30S ribosomal protein S16 [Armatimonadia bacterium]
MVKIRLRRQGAKNNPMYRVVVADAKAPRDGGFLEIIGHYNPRTQPPVVEIDKERTMHWLGVGAQPTEAARALLRRVGIMEAFVAQQDGKTVEPAAAEAAPATPEPAAAETAAPAEDSE